MLLMGMALLALSGSSPLLSSTSAMVPTVHIFDEKKWEAEQRKLRKKFTPICKKIVRNRDTLDVIINDPEISDSDISDAAEYLLAGEKGCSKNTALAIALLDRMVAPAPFTVPRAYIAQLAQYSIAADTALPPERWWEIGKILWARGDSSFPMSDLTDAEKRAFIARDDVWAYLMGEARENWERDLLIVDALFDPQSPRYDPVAAVGHVEQNLPSSPTVNYDAALYLLNNPELENSEARAFALLRIAAPYVDVARIRYFDIVRPKLASDDPEIRNSAVQAVVSLLSYSGEIAAAARQELSPVFSAYLAGSDEATATQASVMLAQFYRDGIRSAETALLPWLDKRLRSGNEMTKAQSLSALSSLATAGSSGAQALIDAEIARAGGAVEFGLVGEAQGFRASFIGPDDYPPSAMRAGEQGIVSVRLLVSPGGRVVQGVVEYGAYPRLDEQVIRVAKRRLRLKIPEQAGRYVWVRIPLVQFRLSNCEDKNEYRTAAAGAIAVDGPCRVEVIYDSPTI